VERKTYVVQRAPTLTKLNDLDRSIEAVKALVAYSRVPSELETCIEMCATSFLLHIH
jgi:hypothetical protein